jgi:hypothetical protein
LENSSAGVKSNYLVLIIYRNIYTNAKIERSFSPGQIENTDIAFILECYYFDVVIKFKNLLAKISQWPDATINIVLQAVCVYSSMIPKRDNYLRSSFSIILVAYSNEKVAILRKQIK